MNAATDSAQERSIIARIKDGLGNQLFQYAAARSLSLKYGAPLKLDLGWFDENSFRRYELDAFRIQASRATAAEIARYHRGFFRKVLDRALPRHLRRHYKDSYFAYDPQFFTHHRPPLYMKGLWQSEKYFLPVADVIRRELSFREPFREEIEQQAALLRAEESVAIHIRRTDYLQADLQKFHGVCDVAYYKRGIAMIRQRHADLRLYVFTDDPAWAAASLDLGMPFTLLSDNVTKTALEDLYLMQNCRHQVIANSTFSWWGGWLNANPDKIVVAPQRWFQEQEMPDIIPDSWLRA